MPKKRIYRGSEANYRPPAMDEEMFHTLFDILHDNCFRGNYSATARALQISVLTARKWAITPPKRHWELHNLHKAIKEVHNYMAASKHKKIRKRADHVVGRLRFEGLETMADTFEQRAANHSEACAHVLSLIAHRPTREISSDEMFLAANMGGFSKRILTYALGQMGIEHRTRGAGKDKMTWYYIPQL